MVLVLSDVCVVCGVDFSFLLTHLTPPPEDHLTRLHEKETPWWGVVCVGA